MTDQLQNSRVVLSGVPEGFDGRVITDVTRAARSADQPGLHLHVVRDDRRLEELQAAFLRVKLKRLAEWNARRAALAQRYLAQLRGVGDLVLPFVPAWAEPVWHLFVVRTARRAALQAHLAAAGVGTQVHYPTPPHLTPAYRNAANGWRPGDFPLAEKLAGEVLSLPIGPHHSAEQIDFVCASVRAFFASA